ncbi:hypothetical protein [Treponema sp. OMZ 857]|uniref:hypothetical protein n=1 Tax=Treponema sp. OMZ 857 TaxID=1643513 RepID=UPI0020A402CD|nr:hypothetical protein [Treponema sp. OMZ 857]UTC43600.1 hypothetical protein E4N66_05670 [Treponema sp. OMZ 857]
MKKMNHVVSFVLIVLTVLAGVTCKPYVGLGGQIDILPPSGKIDYPDAGETPIRGSFVLKGTASDDDGIQSISVVFENIETKERSSAYRAEGFSAGDVSASWTINVNNESTGTEPGHELVKVYPIPDGEYTAIVSVTDKVGKTSTFTKNYKIDNTPPVFIVQRPSMFVDESTSPSPSDPSDGYGSTFSVVGQVGEKNTVEKLNVHVPGTPPIDITNMFVGNNINARVAVSEVISGNETNPLYNLQAQDKTKPIRSQLYLYDNARKYTGGVTDEGNKADWYYQWDSIYTDVIAKGYTPEVISDYFAGKKGSDKDEHDKKIKELRNDTAALNILKTTMIKMTEKRSTFKLDPSQSPGFTVVGVKSLPVEPALTLSDATSMLFKSGGETAFSIELIRNKNNTPLTAGFDLARYKESNIEIVLHKWNKAAGTNEADSLKNDVNCEEKKLVKFSELTDTSNITVVDGKLRVKCVFDPSWGEGYYAVKVKGSDTSGADSNKFEAYDTSNTVSNSLYIINFLATGSGPRIRPIRPQGFKNTTVDIEADVTGIDSTGAVYYNIGAPVNAGSPDTTKILTKVSSDPGNPRYKATVVLTTDSQGKLLWNGAPLSDGIHKIHFLAKTSSGSTDTDTTEFTVDNTGPTIEIVYPEETNPQAGEIVVSGRVSDEWAGVNPEKTKYILGKKTPAPTVDTAAGWKIMKDAPDTSTKGSWSIHINLDNVPSSEYGAVIGRYRKIPLYVFTEDELGNKAVHEKQILFDTEGTKPIVKVLSPQNTTPTTKLGGTIQIFGTASVPKGGPAAVREVYIQFSRDGNFTSAADGTFGTINWYNSGNGQLIPGTDTNGGADWRISINGDGSFNHATNQNQDVYFRVRAKNKNGTSMGDWSDKIKIIVDKSAPTIGSPNAVKVDDSSSTVLAGSANAKDYTPNMWVGRNKKLIGSLKDDSGIKAVQIASTGLAGGVNYDLAQAKAAGWIADAADGNYELKIPFDLDALSSAAKAAGEFSVTISITENTTSPALSTQQTFTFRFDTTDPIGDFGTDKYMNIGNFASDSITDAQLAQKVKDLGATESSGGGCKILADNHILTATKVTGDKIEFTASPALTAGRHSYILYKPETLIYKNNSGKWIVNGVANDSGSGVAEVKVHVTVNGIDSPETVINETHQTNRITKQLGGTVTWKGELDFGSVSDGKGKLHYTITDKSGNTYMTPGVDVVVKNKPVKVSKVILQTEIGGQPVTTDKLNPAETDPQTTVTKDTNDAQLNQTKTVESKNFAFKSTTNSKIKVEFSGGQGTVKYRLRKSDGTLLQDLTAVTSGSEIDLTTHFGSGANKINNSNGTPTTIKLELWDEAYGFDPGTTSSWAKVDITTLFDALDTKPPTVVILPFHWNSETDNSLYQNSRANGHVEIAKINSLGNDYSSVSGKVTLRGFAYDNVQLKTLTATLPNASNITVTNTNNTWSISEDASKNIKFKVEESKYDYLGYYVKWKLEWDSEKTSVGLGKTISVSAHDGTNSSGTSAADPSSSSSSLTRDTNDTAEHADFAVAKPGQFILFTKGEAQHLTRVKSVTGNKIELINAVDTGFVTATLYKDTTNDSSISVNVVPYITGVSRNSTYNTNRARSGAIPLLRGEAGNTLTGFNLDGSTPSLKITANKDGSGSFPVEMESLTLSSDKKSFTFKVPDTAKDGYLHLVVNGVAAVNNINAYTASNTEKSDTYGTAKHSDDRFVHIWRVSKEDTFKGSKNAIYPAMTKDSNGELYASFSNYSNSDVYYSNQFTGDTPVAVAVDGNGTRRVLHVYDPPEETDITVNGGEVNVLYAANYHNGSATDWGNGTTSTDGKKYLWNDTNSVNAGGIYLYDKDAPKIYRDYKGYRFELFTYDNELQQFKNIRTVRSGDNIYVVYYDRLTAAAKFAWVDDSKTPNTSLKALPWCVIDGNTDVTDRECAVPDAPADAPADQKKFTFVSPNGSTYASPYVLSNFEPGLSVSNAVWESVAVTVTKNGYPVVVYMDAATGSLRLARSTSKQPTSSADWTIQKVLDSSDPNGKIASDYINACIGSDGVLHIAFQNTKGQLVYVKSTNMSDDGSTKYTFGESEVLDDSGMSIDMTMDGTTPYITYMSRPNSYDAIRIAYKTSMDFNNTGTDVAGWETMTAPLNQRAANGRICIETKAKYYNTTEKMPVAVGFKTSSDYRAAFYVGK